MSGSQNTNYEIIDQSEWDSAPDDPERSSTVFDALVAEILNLSLRDTPERQPAVDNVIRNSLHVPAQVAFDSRNAPLTSDSFIPDWDAIPEDENFRL